jgi:hypothetical protein
VFEPIVAALSKQRGVTLEPGWGEGNFVLKVGGKIFAILGSARLVVKLPKARVDEIVGDGEGERFDPRRDGRVMKEWLVAGRTRDWMQLAKEAHAFVREGAKPSGERDPR